MGDKFKGVYNLYERNLQLFTPSKQTVTESVTFEDITDPLLDEYIGGEDAARLRDELALIDEVYPAFDTENYRKAEITPVFFGSALHNFGVRELLDCFLDISPAPYARDAEERSVKPEEEAFTGFVFKIHANMDPNHRDRIAFVRITSGIFRRNTFYHHVRLQKKMRFSSPTSFMASQKSIVEEAYPGDIVGIHDTGNFKIGDTLTEGEPLHFKGMPSFSPELFKYIVNDDPMKYKQLDKGIDQLMDEGVAQLFKGRKTGRKIIGTVGQLQFEVIQYRLLHEYGASARYEPITLYKTCWFTSKNKAQLEDFRTRKSSQLAVDKWGREVFLAESQFALQMAQEKYPDINFHFTSEFEEE